jgi:hypothetical protein
LVPDAHNAADGVTWYGRVTILEEESGLPAADHPVNRTDGEQGSWHA